MMLNLRFSKKLLLSITSRAQKTSKPFCQCGKGAYVLLSNCTFKTKDMHITQVRRLCNCLHVGGKGLKSSDVFFTHRFSQDQCVLHEVSWVCGSAGCVKQTSSPEARVDRVVQHAGGDAVETHHVRQGASFTLRVRKGVNSQRKRARSTSSPLSREMKTSAVSDQLGHTSTT